MDTFTAYFDASGSPDDLRTAAVVVGGFVASAEKWIEFARNWNDTLCAFEVPALHMREFAHSTGLYRSWKGDEQKRQNFLGRLINVCRTRLRHSFVSGVMMEDYRKVNEHYFLEELLKPYTIASCTCVSKVKKWAAKWGIDREHIAYFFEDGDKDKGAMIYHMKRIHGFEPHFLPKEQSVAFQAADLIAYEHLLANTKIYKIGFGMVRFRELRYPMQALGRIQHGSSGEDWGIHERGLLEEGCRTSRIPERKDFPNLQAAIAAKSTEKD